ncbi:MAG: hypothetical protein ABW212_05750 [Pseudonocardia sediminis]
MTEVSQVRTGRTGRPPLTDRVAILAAARRIGFTGLTVGTVTAEVGVKYSTFYRHFASFEHLQSAMVDAVLSEAEFPAPEGPWRSYLARTSARMVDLLTEHPGLAQVIITLPERPDRLVELFGQATQVLLGAGFDARDAVLGAAAAFDLAVTTWADSPGASSGGPSRGEQARTTPHELDAGIRAALVEMVDDPPARWVAVRADLVLDGLEARLARQR